jgi:hypothetical protein
MFSASRTGFESHLCNGYLTIFPQFLCTSLYIEALRSTDSPSKQVLRNVLTETRIKKLFFDSSRAEGLMYENEADDIHD